MDKQRVRKETTIRLRVDETTLRMLADLKIMHPGKKQSRIIRDAIAEKHAHDLR